MEQQRVSLDHPRVRVKGMMVDIRGAQWRKSTRATPSPGHVEFAHVGEAYLLRDSSDPTVVLVFTQGEWEAFIGGAQDGEFDRPNGDASG